MRRYVCSKWLRDDVLGGDGLKQIMVYPVGDMEPLYRDEYRKPHNDAADYDWYKREDHQASFAGVPAMVLSVSQVAYLLNVTEKSQLLPITVSLMSGVGTHQALVALVQEFTSSTYFLGGIKEGELAFPVEATAESIWNR